MSISITVGFLLILPSAGQRIVAIENFSRHQMFQHELFQAWLLNRAHIDFGYNQCERCIYWAKEQKLKMHKRNRVGNEQIATEITVRVNKLVSQFA